MGLNQATIPAASSSSRRRIFTCETLTDHVLLAVGRRPAESSGDNLLADGGVLRVDEGQCALLVSRGKVIDFCASPGTYVFRRRQAAEPMRGPLEQEVLETWKRLTRPQTDPEDTRLYYVNLRSVPGPDFRREVPFLLRLPADGLEVDLSLVCSGRFTYRICDPVLFYTNVTGSVDDQFDNGDLNGILHKEISLQLQTVLARLAEKGGTYPHRAAFAQAIAEGIEEELAVFWPGLRGITLDSVTVSDVHASGEGNKLFSRWLAQSERTDEAEAGSKNWFCPDCGAASTGNFCPQCGRKKPESRQ